MKHGIAPSLVKQRVTAKLDGVEAHGVHMEEAVEQLAKLLEVKYPGRWVPTTPR